MIDDVNMDERYEVHDGRPFKGNVVILRLSDMAEIPSDQNNMDYQKYLSWKALGGKAEVFDDSRVPTTDDLRKSEYDKQGASTDALVVALWEKIVEDRPEAADALQAIRDQVKLDIPKGE